jgi:hypothetical protein
MLCAQAQLIISNARFETDLQGQCRSVNSERFFYDQTAIHDHALVPSSALTGLARWNEKRQFF